MNHNLFDNIIYVIKDIYKYQKKILLLLPIGFIVPPLCQYIWAFVLQNTVDHILQNKNILQLVHFLIVMGCIILVLLLVKNIYTFAIDTPFIIVRMKKVQEKNLKMMRMPFHLTEDANILDLSQKAEAAICDNSVGFEGMERNISNLLENLGVFIIGIYLFYKIDIHIILYFLIVASLGFITNLLWSIYSKKSIWDSLSSVHRKDYYMNWTLASLIFAKEIRLFNLRNYILDKVYKINEIKQNAYKKYCRVSFVISIFNSIVFSASQIYLYYYLIKRVISKEITPGEFTLYLSSALFFYNSISNIFKTINLLFIDSKRISDFRLFMRMGESEITETEYKKIEKSERNIIEFKNVSFKYPNSKDFVLKNINFILANKDKIAIVGLNGAGKSTIIKLLLRLYSPTEGEILYNGININSFSTDEYSSLFSVEFQDIKTYSFSILENISMENQNTTNIDKVNNSILLSGLNDKVNELKDGLFSKIGVSLFPDGIELSGGEKQKLAFARALYKTGKIFIFDEPASAMDSFAEKELYDLFKSKIYKPTIFISHRLSSTKFFDRIIVLKDGEIIESGTHESLLAEHGYYYNLYNTQARTFD